MTTKTKTIKEDMERGIAKQRLLDQGEKLAELVNSMTCGMTDRELKAFAEGFNFNHPLGLPFELKALSRKAFGAKA